MKREEFDPQYVELITRMGERTHSREQKYLLSFSEDFKEYLKNGEWYINNLDEARKVSNTYWDFLCAFEDLRERMKEFSWTAEKLLEHGINFKEIRKLYFAVA